MPQTSSPRAVVSGALSCSSPDEKCPLQPQFDKPAGSSSSGERVKLSTEKYVQLLIEARETDPACWPPGLEKAAEMLERARVIEEQCQEKHGDFIPERLSASHSREYFEIQLALDELQDELHERHDLGEDAVELVAQHAAEVVNKAEESAKEGHACTMAPLNSSARELLDHIPEEAAVPTKVPAAVAQLVAESWPEMPPPARGDNFA